MTYLFRLILFCGRASCTPPLFALISTFSFPYRLLSRVWQTLCCRPENKNRNLVSAAFFLVECLNADGAKSRDQLSVFLNKFYNFISYMLWAWFWKEKFANRTNTLDNKVLSAGICKHDQHSTGSFVLWTCTGVRPKQSLPFKFDFRFMKIILCNQWCNHWCFFERHASRGTVTLECWPCSSLSISDWHVSIRYSFVGSPGNNRWSCELGCTHKFRPDKMGEINSVVVDEVAPFAMSNGRSLKYTCWWRVSSFLAIFYFLEILEQKPGFSSTFCVHLVDGIEIAVFCFCKKSRATCVLLNSFFNFSQSYNQSLPGGSTYAVILFPAFSFFLKHWTV